VTQEERRVSPFAGARANARIAGSRLRRSRSRPARRTSSVFPTRRRVRLLRAGDREARRRCVTADQS
jgi:hypothetical protein